jgi:steroid delta-isomerase-like uncharacterized protein
MATNAAIARRWFEEVWKPGGEAVIDELMAADASGEMEGGTVRSRDDFKVARRQFLSAFPDLDLQIEDILAQDEAVVVRWRAAATHRGDGLGFPATNKPMSVRGMTWMELRDGRLTRGWDCWNLGGVIASLQADAAKAAGS